MKRIDVLPDDVLLEIFDFYRMMDEPSYGNKRREEAWQSLVHVCRRWRNLVFGSPRRLNLRLCCSHKTPATDRLDVWPALPLIVTGNMASSSGVGNIITALGQSKRIYQVDLQLAGPQLEHVLAAMQVPFPELTYLRLQLPDDEIDETPVIPGIPDSFLGQFSPRLRIFQLSGIPFPGLPNLLLSATHLSSLRLHNIRHSGYISPEAIVALLSALSGLSILSLEFRSPQSRPDGGTRSLRPPKRTILPALHTFRFKGVTEYLEDLVTFIDTPHLYDTHITFFNQFVFDCPRLAQLINRTPKLGARDEAHVRFDDSTASVTLRYLPPRYTLNDFRIDISCRESDWQLSSIEQVCNTLHSPFTAEHLYIEHRFLERIWKNDAIENTLWLQLLLPFTAVKNLYLSKEFVPGIAAALRELTKGRITGVLPGLQNIFVEGHESSEHFQADIEQFIAARQLSGHYVALSHWPGDKNTDTNHELNESDAFSYIDTVQAQFNDRPDVYDFFLDILRDFKSDVYVYSRPHHLPPLSLCVGLQAAVLSTRPTSRFLPRIHHKYFFSHRLFDRIDPREVMERISTLFRDHPPLVQGLNTFLPERYRVEVASGSDASKVTTITTPSGSML